MRGKPLILKKLDNGCIVPTSHKLNADVYLDEKSLYRYSFGGFIWCVVLYRM